MPRSHEGFHVSFSRPGTAHKCAILGFDALRVFVPAEEFEALVLQFSERLEKGPLADAVEPLCSLNGDY